jgi:hypothetical protein
MITARLRPTLTVSRRDLLCLAVTRNESASGRRPADDAHVIVNVPSSVDAQRLSADRSATTRALQ